MTTTSTSPSSPALLVVLLLLFSLCSPAHSEGDLYVQSGGTSTTCASVEDACGSIQAALDVATEGQTLVLGEGEWMENLRITVAGLTLKGSGHETTKIASAGGVDGMEAPEGVAADIVLDLLAANVTIQNVGVVLPEGVATKRDIGIFVRPPAVNAKVESVMVERKRTGDALEPTMPGSRGLLVFRATGVQCRNSTFQGNFEDHIHLPTSQATITGNTVTGATRIGIVVIQETPDSDSTANDISGNTVRASQSDGIQIQGDDNTIASNTVYDNGGYGIYLCGNATTPAACVAPGTASIASGNDVRGNMFEGNNEMGNVEDKGTDNDVVLETTTDEEGMQAPDSSAPWKGGSNYVMPLFLGVVATIVGALV